MNYKGVIFDLDGVIVQTDRYHYLAWKQLADRLRIPFNETVNRRLRGVSRMESLEIVLEASSVSYSQEQKEALAAEKNEIYRGYLSRMTPADVSREVLLVLTTLKTSGVKLAIGSSSKNAKLILRKVGLEGFFHAVSDGTNIVNSKPDPEVFLAAQEMLGLEPKECLVVEDAVAGVQAAFAGGMDCAAVGDAAKAHIATYELARFSELIDLVI